MKGLEISKKYYKEYGENMIKTYFAEYENKIAVGLVGEGSECFGFDDNFSRDHDYEPSFCMWLTKEDYEKIGFKLERAYAKLPKSFMGETRQIINPVGGSRHGVMIIDDFYRSFLGTADVVDDYRWWLYARPNMLAVASNGEVFKDDLGKFLGVRNKLKQGYPEEIRLKKLCANLLIMAQSGQYNYSRCIKRGEKGAGAIAFFEFVKSTISTIYLLNNAYEPFYKWSFKGLEKLDRLSELRSTLEEILEFGNSKNEFNAKLEIIDDIAGIIVEELKNQGITSAVCRDLEKHAYSVNDKIKNAELRNLHVLEGL